MEQISVHLVLFFIALWVFLSWHSRTIFGVNKKKEASINDIILNKPEKYNAEKKRFGKVQDIENVTLDIEEIKTVLKQSKELSQAQTKETVPVDTKKL